MTSILLIFSTELLASSQNFIGKVKTLTGEATVQRNNQYQPLHVGQELYSKDVVITKNNTALGITFIDNSTFSLGENTQLSLAQFSFDRTTRSGRFRSVLKQGRLLATSGNIAKYNEGAMSVETPTSILGVRGTKFIVEVGAEK